jgi:3-dehydroquinate synthetase
MPARIEASHPVARRYRSGYVFAAMQHDKKKSSGKIKFALPVRIGEVKPGVVIDNLELIQSSYRREYACIISTSWTEFKSFRYP